MSLFFFSFTILLSIIKSEDSHDQPTSGTEILSCRSDTGNFRWKILDGDHPFVLFGDKNDKARSVYCIEFDSLYEASYYNSTSCTVNEISNTKIDFQSLTFHYTNSTDCKTFSIYTSSSNGVDIRFDFEVKQFGEDPGIEYTMKIENYVLKNANAKLILNINPTECKSAFNIDSSEDGVDSKSSNRRLSSNDGVSDDGVSSDDSDEFDLEAFSFKNTPNATRVCNDNSTEIVAVDMCYEGDLLIAIDNPGIVGVSCNIMQDPDMILDESKVLKDDGYKIKLIVSCFVVLLFTFVTL